MHKIILFLVMIVAMAGFLTEVCASAGPDYNREVRPILSQHCFKCHGPDDKQRASSLRLDLRTPSVLASSAGSKQDCKLLLRINSAGSRIMPPVSLNKPLSSAEKEILRRWIVAGAEYKPHWAFVAPRQSPLPLVKNSAWPQNPIDRFVLARLERVGLKPSPSADKYTLARRVYLDLVGLPPSPAEVDAFIQDRRPDAYERLVDKLLASPHYGERWARRWLDLARYADTNGFEKDRPRSVWLYRDWVINALNKDMPFNRFTIEQIAGDMLPTPTIEQRIATGFHRMTMLNEEGGIDPLEYRFYNMVDRVATTGTAFLGLTVGCAQCHTHKFDPITQTEYYRFMACLDNADEPTLDVPVAGIAAKRKQIEAEIVKREAALANSFPVEGEYRIRPALNPRATTTSGAKVTTLPDKSILLSGINPETDTYKIELESGPGDVSAIRLETLTDPSLGNGGPGRTSHGNFVLTQISATVAPSDSSDKPIPVKLVRAEADFSQDGFPAQNALSATRTGWAIATKSGSLNVPRSAIFILDKTLHFPKGGKWTITLEQSFGQKHTIGRFRIGLGQFVTNNGASEQAARRANLERHFRDWAEQASRSKAVAWRVLRPTQALSNLPLLTVQNDDSVFVSGDMSKRDVYDLDFKTDGAPITAIRLEVLPDERLPMHGPGRTYYEGAFGDFFLSEVKLNASGKPVKFKNALQSGGSAAAAAIDGDPQTGWTINGRQGESTIAVFALADPVKSDSISLQLLFERYHAAGLGRFRISVTSDARPATAEFPPDVEAILVTSSSQRTTSQNARLMQHYLSIAPELQSEREFIATLRRSMPELPTTPVFVERPSNNPRLTYLRNRGEYLQPKERVLPGTLAVLQKPPSGAELNRLAFAKWLVSPDNPLAARVAMNRQWAAFFGRGLVNTTEDFGYQGDLPTHPELLDWLAVEFMKQGWSLKKIHKLIVMSATYRQSSRVTPEHLVKDPENRLLSRGPRIRLEAELLRDQALTVSGLLSRKIGGPSVFPPQPPGVTSEGTFGALVWNVSQGEDRYRRGLYTFSKRTAPYAMFTTFDGPSGETCVARRDVSNTPLQALTLLNDQVFVETAQTLGKTITDRPGSDKDRALYLFRLCLTRPPDSAETELLAKFYAAQKERFEKKELNAAAVALPGSGDIIARAAWTVVARSLLNMDEMVTKR